MQPRKSALLLHSPATFLLLTAVLLIPEAVRGQTPAPLQKTMSASGEFSVFGSTAPERLAVSRRADQLLEGWKTATRLPGEKEWPVVINLLGRGAAAFREPRTTLFLGDGDTIKIQVDVPAGSARGPDFEIAILRALALEFAYREVRPKQGKRYVNPPEWLVEGIWQEIAATESGLSAKLFERLVESGPPPKLETFIRMRPESMDPTSRAIYRSQAMTLLRALSSPEFGEGGIAKFLSDLHSSRQGDPSAILDAFPAVREDPSKLVKLWTLTMARASASDRISMLSAQETNAQLEVILAILKSPENPKDAGSTVVTGPLAMPLLSREEAGRYLLRRSSEDLLRLEGRAHPLFRPVIEEFRAVAADLSIRRRRGAEKRLAAAQELREALNKRVDAIADHMNWFEASQLDTPSEAFSLTLGQTPLLSVPPRRDPISMALDNAARSFRQ